MKIYLTNILKSIIYFSIFGIIYNFTVRFISYNALEFEIEKLQEWFYSSYYFVYKNLDDDNILIRLIHNKNFIIVVDGIINNFFFSIITGIILTYLTSKIDSENSRKVILNKTIIFSLLVTFVLGVICFIFCHIWSKYNKDKSWFPDDKSFEIFLPATWMYEYKAYYLVIGILLGIRYLNKKKASH